MTVGCQPHIVSITGVSICLLDTTLFHDYAIVERLSILAADLLNSVVAKPKHLMVVAPVLIHQMSVF